MKNLLVLFFSWIIFLSGTPSFAMDIVILGGPTLSDPSFTQSSVPTNKISDSASASGVGFTVGALVRVPLTSDFILESGLTYLQRNYTLSVLGTTNYSFDETLKGIHIPVLIRANVFNNLSVGLGGYFFHGLGDVHDTNITVSGSQDGQSDQANSYDYNQYSRNDFGLEGSLAYDFPVSSEYSVTVDIRYLLGLTDIGSGSSTMLKSRDALFMAGLKLAL